jgi:hypothetical protein
LQKTCAKQPKEIEPWIALAELAQRGGDEKTALAKLTEAQHRLGNTAALRQARLRLLPRKQATRDLVQPVCAGMEQFPDKEKVSVLEEAGELLYRSAQPEQSEHFFQEALKLQPYNLRLRLRLAELACRPGQETAALAHLQEIERRAGAGGTLASLAEEARDMVNAWQRGYMLGLELAKEKLAARSNAFWRGPETFVEHALAQLDRRMTDLKSVP